MTYLITKPGYDPVSGLFLAPIGTIVEVPVTPTPEQVQAAADLLLEPWLDFSFASPGQDLEPEVSRSVALYGMIVATNRRALDIAPGIAIDAPAEGMSSGKTLASKILCIIATGEEPVPVVIGSNFDEQRKALVTYLVMGNGALLIDNITNGMRVDSAALASMMTSPKFMDRLLGANKTINANTQVMVAINGNALNLAGDLASRFLKLRLDTRLEKPQNRSSSNYKIKDLISWTIENRQRLVAAVHTIVRAYLQDCRRHGGTPAEVVARRRVAGSRFGGQCEVLRDAFLWAFPGLPDPFLGGEASLLASSTRQEKMQVLHLLDQRMMEMAGQKRAPAWIAARSALFSQAEQPERKRDWQIQFLRRCGRMTSDARQRCWGFTEHNQAESVAWNRIKTAMLTRLGRPEVRTGRAKFSSSDILNGAGQELRTTLQAMLPREVTLSAITLGRWLKTGLVDSVIDGLVMRSVQSKGKAQFWVERA